LKATLDFDLSDHDDVMDHKRCVKALDMALVLWEFYHNSKKSLEYQVDDKIKKDNTFDPYDTIDLIYEHFAELLDEHDVNIDNLVE